MEEKTTERKRKVFSALITLLFSGAVMVVLLFFFGFKTPLPLPEEEGVVIELGGGGGGGGGEYFPEEYYESSSDANSGDFTEDVVTDANSTAHVKGGQTSTGTSDNNTPTVDNRVKGFKWGQGTGQGTGIGSGTGTGQGTGNGTGIGPGDGNNTGPGNFNLVGRKSKSIPQPKNTTQKEGRVVVNIWVDRAGLVVRAEAGAIGTTISNTSLWKDCENAAMKAKFYEKEDAVAKQVGTITYIFINQN